MRKPTPTISKDLVLPPGLDYARLRAEGIASLQQLSGHTWTDYNEHDPGVTILESLCYALTDLTNRAAQPIPDLLASAPGANRRPGSALAPAHQVFSNHPVSLHDYKKIVLDKFGPRIKNVWIERRSQPGRKKSSQRSVAGEYSVRVELPRRHAHEAFDTHDSELKPSYERVLRSQPTVEDREKLRKTLQEKSRRQLRRDLLELLNDYRGLGEEFTEVIFLEPRPLIIGGNLEIKHGYLQEEVVADVLWQINSYLDPYIPIVGLKDLVAAGVGAEAIFEGPLLGSRLLQDQKFKRQRLTILPANLHQRVMQVEGIRHVGELLLYEAQAVTPSTFVQLTPEQVPALDAEASLDRLLVSFRGISLHFDRDRALRKYLQLHHANDENLKSRVPANKLRFKETQGSYQNLGQYDSIQRSFPLVYGVGEAGVPVGASAAHHAQSLQLKGFLLFFEQIMANYCAQVAHTADLFSPRPQQHTAFTEPLYDVPHVQALLADFDQPDRDEERLTYDLEREWETFKADPHNAYRRKLRDLAEQPHEFLERRSSMLTHLLARFGYVLTVYSPVLTEPGAIQQHAIQTQERMLRHLSVATYHRGAARMSPHSPGLGSPAGVSGLEFFLYLLTGIGYYHLKAGHHQRLTDLEQKVHLGPGEAPATAELVVHGSTPMDFTGFLRLMYQQLQTPALKKTSPPLPNRVQVETGVGVELELVGRGLPQAGPAQSKEPAPSAARLVLSYLGRLDAQLERFILIDHRTLQPRATESDAENPGLAGVEPEFYQYQVTLCFPSYSRQFRHVAKSQAGGMTYSYREYIHYLVLRHAPAHLLVNICWLDYPQMRELEHYYAEFAQASGLLNARGRSDEAHLPGLQQQLTVLLRQYLAEAQL
ncbi:hypothetical protein LJY25_02725 [Hymenobacter sp. BT175]|uniref:hypothetical protein n=1 Tax=Hymenobacter translucens TaxID=2886507 RepID=UPI001D0F27CA|nr:hypothetical protein [Hymenobacter translucens]MCC2545345.1 hypothetical protein [Hymenobacter translucens]